jgi:hypothetical protein
MRGGVVVIGLALIVAGCGSSPSAKPRRADAPPAKQRRAGGAPSAKQRRADGIPGPLLAGVRPIGRGPRFQPPARGRVAGVCSAPLGRRLQAHIEIFGANRVVLLPAGIGTRPPRLIRDGRLVRARCFGDLATLDPTGVIHFRARPRLTVGDVFSAWGQALGAGRIASFTGGRVRVYVNGRPRAGPPRAVPLAAGAEIVLEVGPPVPPHARFSFPVAPPRTLR